MIEFAHVAPVGLSLVSTCCIAGSTDRRHWRSWMASLMMLVAMLVMVVPGLPAVAALLAAFALIPAAMLSAAGARSRREAPDMEIHRAISALAALPLLLLGVGASHTGSMSGSMSGSMDGHAMGGSPILVLFGLLAVAYVAFSLWLVVRRLGSDRQLRGRSAQVAELVAMTLGVVLMIGVAL